jgi:hypothetical protein
VSRGPIVADFDKSDATRPGHHPLVLLLAVLVFLEAAALAVITIVLILELLVARPDSYASAIALTVITAIAAAWVAAIAVGILRSRAWTRGAAIVVQVLTAAVALGSFQGILPRADIGWILLIPAISVMVLLFTKPVIAAMTIRDDPR